MRFPRLAQAAALVVLAMAPVAAVSLPALAAPPRNHVRHAAVTPPPHARPASHGALPRREPTIPSVPSQESVIARDLMGDGAISAGVFVVLLIPIIFYGSASKRRAAAAAAERDRETRSRADHGRLDDPLLDYFEPQYAPPAALTASQRPAASSRYQPRPGLTGRSVLSPAFAARPMLAAPPGAAGQAADPSWPSPTSLAAPLPPSRRVPRPPGQAMMRPIRPASQIPGPALTATPDSPRRTRCRLARHRRARCSRRSTCRWLAPRPGIPRRGRPASCRGLSFPARRPPRSERAVRARPVQRPRRPRPARCSIRIRPTTCRTAAPSAGGAPTRAATRSTSGTPDRPLADGVPVDRSAGGRLAGGGGQLFLAD